jgi:hypothetical protein
MQITKLVLWLNQTSKCHDLTLVEPLCPQKPSAAVLKPAFPVPTRDVASLEAEAPPPTTVAEKSPEVEEMEIVTAQLSAKLCIEDIDASDGDNPQLCAEYVKEIYEYMMMLEVSLSCLVHLLNQNLVCTVMNTPMFTTYNYAW